MYSEWRCVAISLCVCHHAERQYCNTEYQSIQEKCQVLSCVIQPKVTAAKKQPKQYLASQWRKKMNLSSASDSSRQLMKVLIEWLMTMAINNLYVNRFICWISWIVLYSCWLKLSNVNFKLNITIIREC